MPNNYPRPVKLPSLISIKPSTDWQSHATAAEILKRPMTLDAKKI